MEALLATSLLILCAASTASARTGGFASADEPLDDRGARDAAAFRLPARFADAIHVSPWASARQTAATWGEGQEEAAIADVDPGRWGGMTFERIEADEPSAFQAWLADPLPGAPGGESMADALMRVGRWLDGAACVDRPICAVTHPMVIRLALGHAIGMGMETARAIDIAPLSGVLLSFNRMWRLQALGAAEQWGGKDPRTA